MDSDLIAVAALGVSILGGSGVLAYVRFFRDAKQADREWVEKHVAEKLAGFSDLATRIEKLEERLADLKGRLDLACSDQERLGGRLDAEEIPKIREQMHRLELELALCKREQQIMGEVNAHLNSTLTRLEGLIRKLDG